MKKIGEKAYIYLFSVIIIVGFIVGLIKSFCFDIAMVDGNSMYLSQAICVAMTQSGTLFIWFLAIAVA